MGYWHTDDEGNSFVEHTEMLWGDAPADAMDDALEAIIAAFRRDVGRAPTLAELKAGLLFSAPIALEDDQKRREKAGLYTFAVTYDWELELAGQLVESEEVDYVDATDAEAARLKWEGAQASSILGTSTFKSAEQIEPTRRTLTLVRDE